MFTLNASTSSGTMMIPPPKPVNDPSNPAPSETIQINSVNSSTFMNACSLGSELFCYRSDNAARFSTLRDSHNGRRVANSICVRLFRWENPERSHTRRALLMELSNIGILRYLRQQMID